MNQRLSAHHASELVLTIETAHGFWRRFLGLMFRRAPKDKGRALLLPRCRSIHTAFMRYALDIAWLDDEGRLVGQTLALKPWRMALAPRGARHTLELEAGALALLGLHTGDRVDSPGFSGGDKS